MSAPKLSVLMITYKHERYLAQALDSALMQQTPFDFEIVVAEDKSPDGTRAIVEEYARRHPSRIRPILRDKNVGMHANFIEAYNACQGHYVALLEGDDYWTDPQKLHLQVHAMEAHPDWAISFHPVDILSEAQPSVKRTMRPPGPKTQYDLADILDQDFIPTCSTVFKNRLFGEFPPWSRQLAMMDWPLHALNAQYGAIGFIDRNMGAYRTHAGGVWTAMTTVRQIENMYNATQQFALHITPNHPGIDLRPSLARRLGALVVKYLESGDRKSARRWFRLYLKSGAWRTPGVRRILPKIFYECYLRTGNEPANFGPAPQNGQISER